MKRFIAILMTLIMVLGLSSVGVWADEATWQEETPLQEIRNNYTCQSWNNKIYVFGGDSLSKGELNSTEIYDPVEKTWSWGAPMPTSRYYPTSAVVGDKIYVIGGLDHASTFYDTVEIYDPKNDSWTTGAPMPIAKYAMSAAVVDDKIYILGGGIKGVGQSSTVEIYDTKTNSWSTGTSMPRARSFGCANVINKKIYLIGGNMKNYTIEEVDIYNPETDTWTTGTSIPTPRISLAAVPYNKKIYTIGGVARSVNSNVVEIYNTETDNWELGPVMPTGRAYMDAAIIRNKVFVISGYSGSSRSNKVTSLTLESIDELPSQPLDLTATGGDSVVDLSWDSVSDASYYNVKRSITTGGIYTTIASTSAITYTDSDVTNEITYYYVVSAVNDEGESADSNQASATPQATATPEYILAVLLNVDETVQLSVTYDLADNTNLTWTSSDGAIAIVDGNGKVTAISEGLTYIYAENEDGSFKEFIPVKVVLGDADEMRLAVHLTSGEKALLYLTEDPSNVTWSSMDTSIATISAEGEITAISKGLVIIQAELDGSVYQVYVRVNA